MNSEMNPLVTAREAADLLAVTGLPRTSVRRALTAGVAGQPVRTRGALLYPLEAVRALVREPLTEDTLPYPLDHGTFVLRLRFGVADFVRFTLERDDPDRSETIAGGWQMSWLTRIVLDLRASQGAPMPLLATCGGFIVAGATVVGAHLAAQPANSTSLDLGPAGSWYADLHHRILRTPPGRPWTILPRTGVIRPWIRLEDTRDIRLEDTRDADLDEPDHRHSA